LIPRKGIFYLEGKVKKVIDSERIPIKLWLDNIEPEALQQAKNLANLPFAFKWVAVMPDAHSGYGMPIGGVLATNGVIIPNAVGVDIGCGMRAVRTDISTIGTDAIKEIMGHVRLGVPVGFNRHIDNQLWPGFDNAPDLEIVQRELPSAMKQLGTLGGGNHFIEIQQGNDGFVWFMIHSGSRNFGLKTADYYHKWAQKLNEQWYSNISDRDLAFMPIDLMVGGNYYEAMKFCLAFAHQNRLQMAKYIEQAFVDVLGIDSVHFTEWIDVHHNYASVEQHFGQQVIVHRKGAVSARDGEVGIIPGSMGTPSYITRGLGNPDSFQSSSHGAGRRMGRGVATRTLDLQEEQNKMAGIVHGLRTVKDLDEAPGAYKSIDEVMANQSDLVEISVKLTPLASIKG
jgi:tRNA-splicing ligase RtcB